MTGNNILRISLKFPVPFLFFVKSILLYWEILVFSFCFGFSFNFSLFSYFVFWYSFQSVTSFSQISPWLLKAEDIVNKLQLFFFNTYWRVYRFTIIHIYTYIYNFCTIVILFLFKTKQKKGKKDNISIIIDCNGH